MGRDTIATWSSAVWLAERTVSGGYVYTHRHWNGPAKAYVYSTPTGTWAKCTMCSALLGVPIRRLGRRMSVKASGRRPTSSPWARHLESGSPQPAAAAGAIRQSGARADSASRTKRATARLTVGPKKGGGWQVAGGGETRDVPTQRQGIAEGRQALERLGGGELIVKGRNGRIRSRKTVPAHAVDQGRGRGAR